MVGPASTPCQRASSSVASMASAARTGMISVQKEGSNRPTSHSSASQRMPGMKSSLVETMPMVCSQQVRRLARLTAHRDSLGPPDWRCAPGRTPHAGTGQEGAPPSGIRW